MTTILVPLFNAHNVIDSDDPAVIAVLSEVSSVIGDVGSSALLNNKEANGMIDDGGTSSTQDGTLGFSGIGSFILEKFMDEPNDMVGTLELELMINDPSDMVGTMAMSKAVQDVCAGGGGDCNWSY